MYWNQTNRTCDGVRVPKSIPVWRAKGFAVPRSAILGYHLGQFEEASGESIKIVTHRWPAKNSVSTYDD